MTAFEIDDSLDECRLALEKLFQDTFPELFKELETIRTVEIPKEIDVRKQQIEHAIATKKNSSKVDI